MKKVLLVTHSFVVSDARVRRQIDTFRAWDWKVEVLSLDSARSGDRLRSWQVPMQRRRGSPIRYLWEYGLFFVWTLVWVAYRCWLRPKPTLVYVNSLPDFLVFAAAPARLRGVPVILDVHDPMPELFFAKERSSSRVWRLLVLQERWSARYADAVITVHEPVRDLLARRSPQVDYEVVMNVPDLSDWGKTTWDSQSRTVVFNGSLAVRYGLDDLLYAVALIADRIPSVSVRLIGEGEGREGLLRLAVDLGIDHRLEVIERVEWKRLPHYLKDAWVGFNAPKPDSLGQLSFSNKIVEWVEFGLPVVAGRTSTLERYFPQGTLFYTWGGDPEAIAHTLLQLDASSPEVVREHIEQSRRALEKIGWPVQRARLLEVVERVTASPAP